jgi:hypothetical protein
MGRFDVLFDDGDRENDVAQRFIRLRAPVTGMSLFFNVGQRVDCLFEGALGGTEWYLGTIESLNTATGTYGILYLDGDRETGVRPEFIRAAAVEGDEGEDDDGDDGDDTGVTKTTTDAALPPPPLPPVAPQTLLQLAVGTLVECQFEGALGGRAWYSGVVQACDDASDTYDILYDDGDREEGVLPQFVRLRPSAPASTTASTTTTTTTTIAAAAAASHTSATPPLLLFAVGARVLCQFEGALGGTEWFAGVVEARNNAAGTYNILYDDGDREAGVLPRYIQAAVTAPNQHQRQVGCWVLGVGWFACLLVLFGGVSDSKGVGAYQAVVSATVLRVACLLCFVLAVLRSAHTHHQLLPSCLALPCLAFHCVIASSSS